jgi:CubicO group peptidase (beta-lactamase class C family)
MTFLRTIAAFAVAAFLPNASATEALVSSPGFDDPGFVAQFPATTSVLVSIDGKTVLEKYFPAGGPNVLNDTRSVTKTITALAAGLALKDRKLTSLDAPLLALFQGWKTGNDSDLKRAITLRDALTMSSAFDCDDNDEKSAGAEDRMHEQKEWVSWGLGLPVRADYQRDETGRGPFHYCTINAVLAGHAIGAAVKRPIQDYVQDQLFGPLGITASKWQFSPSGEAMTGGGLRLTTRDLAKLGQLLLDNGRWNGKEILPPAFVGQLLTPYRSGFDQEYGLLIWKHKVPTPCGQETFWYMGGNGGNAVVISQRLKMVAVITRTRYNTGTMWMETGRMLSQHVFPLAPCPKP